jgi:hypothetical protein
MRDPKGSRSCPETSLTSCYNPEDRNLIVVTVEVLNLIKVLSISGMQFLSKYNLKYVSVEGVLFLL